MAIPDTLPDFNLNFINMSQKLMSNGTFHHSMIKMTSQKIGENYEIQWRRNSKARPVNHILK